MQQIVSGLGGQWAQDVLISTLVQEWRQSKRQQLVLKLASHRPTRRIQARCLLSLIAILLAGRWFGDRGRNIYVVSLTRNNKHAIDALSEFLNTEGGPTIQINDKTWTRSKRFITVWRSPYIEEAVNALISGANQEPHVFAQQALGVSAALLFLADLCYVEPRVIGVANDHSPATFSLLTLANMLGIPSFYVQHAPVTQYFPPLSADLTVLKDQSSLIAYRQSATLRNTRFPPAGRIYVQAARPELAAKPVPEFRNPIRICIALSKYFNASELWRFLDTLGATGRKLLVTLKVHPQCSADLEGFNKVRNVCAVSRHESLEELIASNDLFIVSNSGISLDLLRRGVPAIFVDQLDHQWRDYFGLVSGGFLPELTPEEILDPDVLRSYFDASWLDRLSDYFSDSEDIGLINHLQLVEWFKSKL